MGPDHDVGGQAGVGLQEDGMGRLQGGAPVHGGAAEPVLHGGLGLGQLGAGVDAAQLGLGRLDGDDAGALGPGEGDAIGQVVFALGGAGLHGAEPAQEVRGVGAEDAGVAEGDGALGVGGVGPLDDAVHAAVRAGDDAAVAAGVGGAHGEQGEAGAPAGGGEAAQGVGADQRVVGIEHRDVAGAEVGGGLQGGVCGAEAVGLDHHGMRGGGGGQGVHAGAGDDDDPVEGVGTTVHQVLQHGLAGDAVQRLGQGGLHAGAQPGGQQDGGDGAGHGGGVHAGAVAPGGGGCQSGVDGGWGGGLWPFSLICAGGPALLWRPALSRVGCMAGAVA